MELWLDTTSVEAQQPSLQLIFHAFDLDEDCHFGEQVQQCEEDENLYPIADVMRNQSEQVWFELALINPLWTSNENFNRSGGISRLQQELKKIFSQPSHKHSFQAIFLHWVDDANFYWVKRPVF